MRVEPAGETDQVGIQEHRAGLEHRVHCVIAGSYQPVIAQIMNRDRRYGEVERPADFCRPLRVTQIAHHESELCTMAGEPAARLRKAPQHLFAYDSIAGSYVEHLNLCVAREARPLEHLLEQRTPFVVTLNVPPDPVVDVFRRMPIVVADMPFLSLVHEPLRRALPAGC